MTLVVSAVVEQAHPVDDRAPERGVFPPLALVVPAGCDPRGRLDRVVTGVLVRARSVQFPTRVARAKATLLVGRVNDYMNRSRGSGMDRRAIVLAGTAGVAAFILVGVAVSEVTVRWIEFSLFVGIPAGILAGVVAAVAVYLGLTRDTPRVGGRVALGLGTFGATFLIILVVAIVLERTMVMSILLSAAAGAIAGFIVFVRTR